MTTEPGVVTLSTSNLLSLAALGLSILTLIVGYFKFVLSFADKLAGVERRCIERIAKLEGKWEVLWGPLVNVLVKEIKQPIHKEKDDLLDRLNGHSKEMATDELQRLKVILELEMDQKPIEQHFKYAFLLGRIDTILLDRGSK